jgi:hypothetical protein
LGSGQETLKTATSVTACFRFPIYSLRQITVAGNLRWALSQHLHSVSCLIPRKFVLLLYFPDPEDSGLLEYDPIPFGKQVPTPWGKYQPSQSFSAIFQKTRIFMKTGVRTPNCQSNLIFTKYEAIQAPYLFILLQNSEKTLSVLYFSIYHSTWWQNY